MNFSKRSIAICFVLAALLAGLAYAEERPGSPAPQVTPMGQFPPAANDSTSSLGSFKIKVVDKFTAFFNSCPNYDATTKTFSSPTLFDNSTIIGRSDVSLTSHDIANTPFELGAVNVGLAGTLIHKDRLLPPPTYPCFG